MYLSSNLEALAKVGCNPDWCDGFPDTFARDVAQPYENFEIFELNKLYTVVDKLVADSVTTVTPLIGVYKFSLTTPCVGLRVKFNSRHGNGFWNLWYYDDQRVCT